MLWQKSPQYQDVPHEQYLQTEEGKRSQQAFTDYGNWVRSAGPQQPSNPSASPNKNPMEYAGASPYIASSGALDMSAYGRAQPIPPQSQGTAYSRMPSSLPAPPPPGGFVYSTAGAPPSFQPPVSQPPIPYAQMSPGVYQNGQQISGDIFSGLQMAQDRRDAQIKLLNDFAAPMSLFGNGMGFDMGNQPPPIQNIMAQAQGMVNSGWQTPFNQSFQNYWDQQNAIQRNAMAQPPVQQAQAAAISDLFSRSNVQAPPGFVDQLLAVLSGNALPTAMPQPAGGSPTFAPSPAAVSPTLRPEMPEALADPSVYVQRAREAAQAEANKFYDTELRPLTPDDYANVGNLYRTFKPDSKMAWTDAQVLKNASTREQADALMKRQQELEQAVRDAPKSAQSAAQKYRNDLLAYYATPVGQGNDNASAFVGATKVFARPGQSVNAMLDDLGSSADLMYRANATKFSPAMYASLTRKPSDPPPAQTAAVQKILEDNKRTRAETEAARTRTLREQRDKKRQQEEAARAEDQKRLRKSLRPDLVG